ncbi:MAG TPA: hypothetical protein VFO79_09245 [Xanthomonadales bacterium]|nr:hypothetical protein [Xanthomonadales bacterium]
MRWLVVAIALCAACGSKKKQQRTSDAAPVIVVPNPVFDGGTGSGGSADEVEPNDSSEVATPLALGTTARGKIEPEADADYYRIEVTQAGALTIMTNLVDADLTVDVEDGSGTIIAKSDRGGARMREGVPNLGVTPGKYTAIVRKKIVPPKRPPRGKRKQPPPAPPATPAPPIAYELIATFAAPPPNVEREPDDDRGTANDLIVGDTAQGFVGWTGDVDLWKLSVETLSEKNSIDIEVGGVDGVALMLELADGIGQPLLVRKAPKTSPLVVKNVRPVVASGAPPFHYLTIKGDKSNPETHYTVRVTAKPVEPDQEAEPNDTPEKAMTFPPERTRVDGVWTAGDVDCYAIDADTNPRTLDIALTPSEIDLSLELVVDGKVIAKSEEKGKGTNEKLSGPVPASTKAIVRVKSAAADATGEGTYELTVREGAAGGP